MRFFVAFLILALLSLLRHTPIGRTQDRDDSVRAEERLRHAWRIAREMNDPSAVEAVESAWERVKKAALRKDAAAVELLIREAEKGVGLDPGGRTMFGLPVAPGIYVVNGVRSAPQRFRSTTPQPAGRSENEL